MEAETRLGWLESIAYWTKQGFVRREMYAALQQHPDESDMDYLERRDDCWKEIKSAEAMVKASLNCMERAYGAVSLSPRSES